MLRTTRGFTMFELLVVVAIIAILALIALPAYQNYSIRSANRGCAMEASGYTLLVVAALHDQVNFPPPNPVRCSNISTAAVGTLGAPGVVTATTAQPGDATVSCSIAPGSACTITSPSSND